MDKKITKISDKDKLIAELYVSNWKLLHDSTMTTIKLYEEHCKMLRNLYMTELDKEPLKLFKTKHKYWQEYIDNLKNMLEKAETSLMEEYKELESVLDLVNFSEKK